MSTLTDNELQRLVEQTNHIRAFYGPAQFWGTSPKRPSVRDFAFIKTYEHGGAFGHYYIIKTSEAYVCMLMDKMNHNEMSEFLFVPLNVPMGVGDFDSVTPDKIHELA